MSRALHETVNVPDAGIDDDRQYYPPWSAPAPSQASRGVPNFVDGSGPIFSMYLEMAEEEDKKMAESWKADADGILIFTGLFSAAVASLISVSVQDIRPNPQDTSNFYLANIYQAIADTNRLNASLPSSPPAFSPPSYAVWVNSLWFMSLVISLTCALLATLLQQWARRYLKVAQPRYSTHKRARIRAFFFEGIEKFFLPWTVEALPTLLHISLFLFFSGLVVFLCNINLTVFKVVLSWVGICTILYGCITFMPIFRHDSPYYTPLSSSVWPLVVGVLYVIHWVHQSFVSSGLHRSAALRRLRERFRKMLLQGMLKTAEETALDSPPEIDTRAFLRTFDTLDEDHELEHFFLGLPGFRSSKAVVDPLPSLTTEQRWKLSMALTGLFDRSSSSDLLPESVKKRRAVICAKAIDPTHTPGAIIILVNIMSHYRYSGPLAAEFVQIVRGWGSNKGDETNLVLRAAVCSVVAKVQQPERDDSWFNLASNELGVSETVLRDYAANGDSLTFAILIHIVRQQFSHYRKSSWPSYSIAKVLEAVSKFNVQNTSPQLQHEFCALWNQIVLRVRNDTDRWYLPRPIREIYLTLHQDTNSSHAQLFPSTGSQDDILKKPSSYPMCKVPGHIHDDSVLTTFSRTVLCDDAALVPASLASPDPPSSSIPAPLHVVKSLTDVPSFVNFHPAHQTTIECLRMPVTSPDPAPTSTIRDIVTSGLTISHPTPETSTSAPPLSSTSPPAAVALQRNPDLLTPSDPPVLSSSPSSNAVLDNMLSAGPSLSSHSPKTRSDLLPSSCPESHRSIVVTTSPSASPGPTSEPAAEDEGCLKPGLRKEEDALSARPSVIHANTMATVDPPPRSLFLPFVTDSDVAIAGSSLREPNAERAGDHPSHWRHDIV